MRGQGIRFITITVCLVIISAFCIGGTAFGKSRLEAQELENYYRQQERQMVQEVRTFLNDNGFANSGVMLTKVLEPDGYREYTLTVHHSKINALSKEEQQALKVALSEMDFGAENCSFCHEFLVTD